MRLDDLPKSGNIEDRRGGMSGFPGGRGGIGIGTIVVLGLIGWALGIDPRILIGGGRKAMSCRMPLPTAPHLSAHVGS
jgi:predicted metalloprotease